MSVAIVEQVREGLPSLVTRAAQALASATNAAEVLEARDAASLAYDMAKKAARLAQAKGAHDTLVAAAHRAQADALLIESQAKRRLADEYDAAQERGEVRGQGSLKKDDIREGNVSPTAADLGIVPRDVHEWRGLRDAEEANPGIITQTVEQALADGVEPTRSLIKMATMREKIIEQAKRDEQSFLDDRDFRALRKVWKSASTNARRMFRDYIAKD